MKSLILKLLPIVFLFSCSKEVRELKYPSTGNPMEKYEVIEANGSFIKDGYYKSWYENGQLKDDGQFQENKKTGEWKSYYENGQQSIMANYAEDEKVGTWTGWYPSGQKLQEELFLPEGGKQTFWYQTGQKKLEGNLKSGLKDGIWNFWTPDGTLVRVFKYVKGKDQAIVGKWKVIDSEGLQHTIEYFPDGTFVATHPDGQEKTHYNLHEETINVGGNDFEILKLTEKEYEVRPLNFSNQDSFKAQRIQ